MPSSPEIKSAAAADWALAVRCVARCQLVLDAEPTAQWCRAVDRELVKLVEEGAHIGRTNIEVLILAHNRAHPSAQPVRCHAATPCPQACGQCSMLRETDPTLAPTAAARRVIPVATSHGRGLH